MENGVGYNGGISRVQCEYLGRKKWSLRGAKQAEDRGSGSPGCEPHARGLVFLGSQDRVLREGGGVLGDTAVGTVLVEALGCQSQ